MKKRQPPGYFDLHYLPEIGTTLSQKGLIAEAQRSLSERFESKRCFFGVNGASGFIQSGIIAMANPGESILMPRNVHISVIKTCALQNITPIFFDLEFEINSGHYMPITKNWFCKVFKNLEVKDMKIAGVVLVNPYYRLFQ